MPAKSEKQRKLMALALHAPSKVRKKNKGVLKMSKEQLHEFTSKVNKKAKSAIRKAHKSK